MAKERINPEFNVQRVVQPTATPVDVYFRPNMVQPDTARQIEIVRALNELNPQLQRLSSDAMAAMVAKEQEIGAIEATSATEEMLRRKQTEYIEKSGGIAPWRYQSFLETAGARMVRDKYQSKMYASLDDLSEPFNQDGTVRDPNYVATKMQEMYDQTGVPANSYYITKGALKTKAQVDEAVLGRVGEMRARKVKEANERQLEDDIASVLDTTPDDELFDAIAPGGKIAALKDTFYSNGFGSGNDQFVSAVSKKVDGLVAEHKYDSARSLVGFMLQNPAAGRALGARNRPLLQQKLSDIEDRQENYEANLDARRERDVVRTANRISNQVRSSLIDMHSKATDGYLNLSVSELNVMAEEAMTSLNVPDEYRKEILAEIVTQARQQVAVLNQPIARNPKVYEDLYLRIKDMNPDAARSTINAFEASGAISPMQATDLTNDVETRARLSPVIGDTVESAIQGTRNGLWTGYELDEFEPEFKQTIRSQGEEAAYQIRDSLFAWASTPENIKASKEDPVRFQMELRKQAQTLIKETHTNLRQENSEALQQFNRRTGFDYIDKSGQLTASFGDLMESTIETMELDPSMQKAAAYRAVDRGRDLIRAAYDGLPPGMTVTEKTDALRKQIPDIVFKVRNEMIAGDSKVVDQNMANAIQAGQKVLQTPAPAGVQTTAGQVAGEAVSPNTWAIFGRSAMSGREATVGKTAQEVASLIGSGAPASTDPDQRSKFNLAKRRLGNDAQEAIRELTTGMTLSEYLLSNASPMGSDVPYRDLKSRNDASLNSPAFEIRQDGFYSLDTANYQSGQKILNAGVTNKYWVYKSLVGYSQKEIRDGKTAEGLDISPSFRDPNTFLYFRTKEEYSAAVDEYNASGGKSGLIAEHILPRLSGITADDFGTAQVDLIEKRKPTT